MAKVLDYISTVALLEAMSLGGDRGIMYNYFRGFTIAAFALVFSTYVYAATSQGWTSVESVDLLPLRKDYFSVSTQDNQYFEMRLIRIETQRLADDVSIADIRSTPFSLIFKARNADSRRLMKTGAQIVSLWHPELGYGDVFISAYQREDGRYFVEAIFN